MTSNNCYVYVHTKTTDNSVFYVGRGIGRRFISKTGRNKHWTNIVVKHGFFSEIIENELSVEESNEREIFWIKKFKEDGCILANIVLGGGGTLGRKKSPEEIASMKAKLIGQKWDEKRRQNWLGNKNGTGTRSEETKKKMSEATKGKSKSDDHKVKLSNALKGRKLSPERCAQISLAVTARHAKNKALNEFRIINVRSRKYYR